MWKKTTTKKRLFREPLSSSLWVSCMSIEQAEHALLNFEYFLHHTQIDVIQKTQNRAFKADDMFESNPVKRSHFTELLKSVTSVMCEIGSGNTKKPGEKNPQRYCNRLIYLFILSALGHCYHDNSLMASFASLFLIFFHCTPFISAISLFEEPSWPL